MVLYIDHTRQPLLLVGITNASTYLYSMYVGMHQTKAGSMVGPTASQISRRPIPSRPVVQTSDSTKTPEISDIITICNIYEHVAMARETTNEPHQYLFYTHIHFALPSWATSRAMHRLYRCVAGQQPPFWAKI